MKHKNTKTVKEPSKWYTNIIAIDPSTTCTGLCINGRLKAISTYDSAHTKKGKMVKWFETTSEHADLDFIENRNSSNVYTEEEIIKLKYYKNLKTKIISEIAGSGLLPENTLVVMEGYSYSSAVGHIIDLVTFSTLIRNDLLDFGYKIEIISPSSLKAATAKMSYEPQIVYKNKKKTRSITEWRNNNGVPGGKFTKTDMMQAILDSKHTTSDWKSFLQEYQEDLGSMKKVPKPIEDLNDAFLLYNVYKNGFNE